MKMKEHFTKVSEVYFLVSSAWMSKTLSLKTTDYLSSSVMVWLDDHCCRERLLVDWHHKITVNTLLGMVWTNNV